MQQSNNLNLSEEFHYYPGGFILLNGLAFCHEVIQINKDGEVLGSKLIYDLL